MSSDIISMHIVSSDDFENSDLAEKFLEIILKQRSEFFPDSFDTYTPAKNKFHEDSLSKAVDMWLDEEQNKKKLRSPTPFKSGSILLLKGRKEEVTYHVMWSKRLVPILNGVSLSINSKNILNSLELRTQFFALFEELLFLFNGVKASIANWSHPIGPQAFKLTTIHPELCHKEYFGQPYIELFGKERLLSTPCYRAEEIREDIISLQLSQDIFTPVSSEAREAVKQHLGVNAFVETGTDFRQYIDKETLAPQFDLSNVTL